MLIPTATSAVILIVIGSAGWALTQFASWTALIPAIIGAILGLLALAAWRAPTARKHVMHGAVGLALLGFAGTVPGLIKLVQWLAGTEPARPAAVVSQSLTAVVLLVFMILAIRSFIAARRSRS